MKITISGFYDEISSSLDRQIEAIKGYGERYLCPRVIDGKNIADYTADQFEKTVKPRLLKNGIRFSSIGSPIGKIAVDDDVSYRKQLDQLAELIARTVPKNKSDTAQHPATRSFQAIRIQINGELDELRKALEAAGKLTVRAHLYPTLSDDHSNLRELQAVLTGPALRAPGFKQFFDGVSSQHTAWCSEPYSNPHFAGDKGRATVEAARMRELVLGAAREHLATRIHAIGDAAVHAALDIFTEANERYGTPAQGTNTIEHVEDIQPQDISRFAQAHVVASVQPPHITIDTTQPARDLGSERASRMWPFDQMLAAGDTLAFGTDAPVVAADSATVLYTACYRTLTVPPELQPTQATCGTQTSSSFDPFFPEHALSRAQALLAYTQGSAAAVGRAHELGKLAPNYYADFVVWDTNLMTCSPAELSCARPLKTFMGGREVYSR